MKRWAFIVNGVVIYVTEQDNQPELPGLWVECEKTVGPEWLYDGNTFSPPPPPEG